MVWSEKAMLDCFEQRAFMGSVCVFAMLTVWCFVWRSWTPFFLERLSTLCRMNELVFVLVVRRMFGVADLAAKLAWSRNGVVCIMLRVQMFSYAVRQSTVWQSGMEYYYCIILSNYVVHTYGVHLAGPFRGQYRRVLPPRACKNKIR